MHGIWPRIISTAGEYTGIYEAINGIDYAISELSDEIRSTVSNGDKSNATAKFYYDTQGKDITINANWNYSNKKLIDAKGNMNIEVTISQFDNINVSKIAMGHGRKSGSGLFRYYSVQLYNRSLTDEEMSVNNRNDKIRFNLEYWS